VTQPKDVSTESIDQGLRLSQPDSSIETSSPVNEKEVLRKFGLDFSEESESVLVTLVDSRGNASQAGLERGDKILSLGGAAVVNPKEFAQIAGLLSDGDQIELIYSRDGKEEKAFIQYGNSADSTAEKLVQGSGNAPSNSNWSATPQNETQRLQQLVEQQRQVIAELQKRVRELEKGSAR
jgi:predicted metalloprotease with PDZ domain